MAWVAYPIPLAPQTEAPAYASLVHYSAMGSLPRCSCLTYCSSHHPRSISRFLATFSGGFVKRCPLAVMRVHLLPVPVTVVPFACLTVRLGVWTRTMDERTKRPNCSEDAYMARSEGLSFHVVHCAMLGAYPDPLCRFLQVDPASGAKVLDAGLHSRSRFFSPPVALTGVVLNTGVLETNLVGAKLIYLF